MAGGGGSASALQGNPTHAKDLRGTGTARARRPLHLQWAGDTLLLNRRSPPQPGPRMDAHPSSDMTPQEQTSGEQSQGCVGGPCGGWGVYKSPSPEGTLGYCTCAQEAVGTKRRQKMARQWSGSRRAVFLLFSAILAGFGGRYFYNLRPFWLASEGTFSVTNSETRRRRWGGH